MNNVNGETNPSEQSERVERLVMSGTDKLCAVFNDLEVEYTRRRDGEYEYIFVGECRNICKPNRVREQYFLIY